MKPIKGFHLKSCELENPDTDDAIFIIQEIDDTYWVWAPEHGIEAVGRTKESALKNLRRKVF